MDEMDEIDALFGNLLGEMDHLTQSLMPAADPPDVDPASENSSILAAGFTDLNESLDELEDHDLDALVADLGSESINNASGGTDKQIATSVVTEECEPAAAPPPPTNTAENGLQKLIIKVEMSDGGSKTLLVDKRQTVREVLDKLFEKTHCDCSIDWSLCEINPELQTERWLEDHEYLVESLSAWSHNSENKLHFLSRPQRFVMFTDPQLLYMWKKHKDFLSGINKEAKQLLIKENFEGSTLIVPDVEGVLYLKEDGRKTWRRRYFMLRASGLYYVPKGKTKSSTDLACFLRFDKVSVYTTTNYKQKFRAPTDFCFVLKHPCIQKESEYVKFLCCDDEHTLSLWANSIRIAKFGAVLYKNYQAAVKSASSLQTIFAHKDKKPDDEPPPDYTPPPPPPGRAQL